MAHEIERQNFFDTTGQPAWHKLSVFAKLGIEKENREYNAQEVYALFGKPTYELAPMFYRMGGTEVAIDDCMIIRGPVADDPQHKAIGRVSEHYELVGGGIAADLWDDHVQLPVETMMMLRNDGVLAITAKLPAYDVKGDGIINYLVFTNGMDGKTSSRADVSGTRVVCENTLAMAHRYTVHHSTGSIDRLTAWMADIAETARFQVDVMRDVYNALAETKVKKQQVTALTKVIFRDFPKPDANFAYAMGYEAAVKWADGEQRRIEQMRSAVMDNWNGAATGFGADDCTTRGTAWHALNSLTEILTHSRTNKPLARAESLLIGQRSELIKRGTDIVIGWSPAAQEIFNRKREPVLVR